MCSWALRGVVDVIVLLFLLHDGDENLRVESSDQNCSDGQAQNSKNDASKSRRPAMASRPLLAARTATNHPAAIHSLSRYSHCLFKRQKES